MTEHLSMRNYYATLVAIKTINRNLIRSKPCLNVVQKISYAERFFFFFFVRCMLQIFYCTLKILFIKKQNYARRMNFFTLRASKALVSRNVNINAKPHNSYESALICLQILKTLVKAVEINSRPTNKKSVGSPPSLKNLVLVKRRRYR